MFIYTVYIVLEPLALSAGLVAQKKKNLCGRLSLLPVNCKSLCKPISKTFTDPDLLTKHRTFNWIFFFHSIQLLPPGCRFQYTGFSKKKNRTITPQVIKSLHKFIVALFSSYDWQDFFSHFFAYILLVLVFGSETPRICELLWSGD